MPFNIYTSTFIVNFYKSIHTMKQVYLSMIAFVLAFSSHLLQAQDVLFLKSGDRLKVKVQEITPQEIKYKRFDNLNGPLITILKSNAQSIKYENGVLETISEETAPIPYATPDNQYSTTLKKGFDVGDLVMINYYDENYEGVVKAINTRRNSATVEFLKKGRTTTVNRRFDELVLTENQPKKAVIGQVPMNQNYSYQNMPAQPQSYTGMYQQGETDAKRYYQGYRGAGTGTFLTTFFAGPILGLIPAIACSSTAPSQDRLGFPNSQLSQNNDYYKGYAQQAHRIKSKKVWGNFGIATGILVGIVIIASSTAR